VTASATAGTPFAGLRVLITCGGDLGDRLAAQVRTLGGTPVLLPLTRIVPPADPAPLRRALSDCAADRFDWVLVTSANGAAALDGAAAPVPLSRSASWAAPGDARSRSLHVGRASIGAVGPATADALASLGLPVDLVPESDYTARGLVRAFLARETGAARRVLLPVSEIAGSEVETALAAAGHDVTRVTAYRTLPAEPGPESISAVHGADVLLVASGSAARALAALLGSRGDSGEARRAAPIAAIGDPTAAALEECGLRADAVAAAHTAQGLIAAAAELVSASLTAARHDSADQYHRIEGARP
jgi:uroporphyrinogen-III synthase